MVAVAVADQDQIGLLVAFELPGIDVNDFLRFNLNTRVTEPFDFLQHRVTLLSK